MGGGQDCARSGVALGTLRARWRDQCGQLDKEAHGLRQTSHSLTGPVIEVNHPLYEESRW